MAVNSASQAGVVPVQQPVASVDNFGATMQAVGQGLSLFAANLGNQKYKNELAAQELENQQTADASNAAANFVSEVQQVKALKGGLAAQTFAAQKFAELQGSLDVGAREMFVDQVKKSLGFNPMQASVNQLVSQEEAKREKEVKDRETATAIYLSSVDINNPEAVAVATANVANMSPEQIGMILRVTEAQDLKVQKEIQRHNLYQEQNTTRDIQRGQAQRTATTSITAGFNKLAAGFQVRIEQAVASGDVNAILAVQKEGLEQLSRLEAGMSQEAANLLAGAGYADVDMTTVNAQLQPLRNQIAVLRSSLKLTDLQSASEATTKYLFTTALNRTSRENTELGRVATAVLSDQLYGTSFGQNYVEKWATKDLLHNTLMFNNIEQDETKASVKKLEDATTQGSVFAVQELDVESPNLPELVADLTSGQVAALRVGVDKEENRQVLATGVVQNWEAAAYGQSTNAIRSKVFEPLLTFFTDTKNAQAYSKELAGTEDVFLAASSEYVKGNVMPALTQAIGLSSQDLSTKFDVVVQDNKFRLIPKEVGGDVSSFSPAGQAAGQATSQRRVVAQAARKTEALYNKILLAYSNIYGVNLNTALEVFSEKYAQSLGVDLIKVEENTENDE